ncbi:MAG: ferric iron reductase [Enterobacter hormaechei]
MLPLFSAEADYGLVLLAHQQNIIVEMQQDFPVGLIYRDCQGSAWTEGADAWLKEAGETEEENRFGESQLLRSPNTYCALPTVTAASPCRNSEENLMSACAALAELRDGEADPLPRLRARQPDLELQGNFFCLPIAETPRRSAVIYSTLATVLQGEG